MKILAKVRRLISTSAVAVLIGSSAYAQHQELSEKPQMYKGKQTDNTDSTSLLSAFKRGRVNGHFRYFFMSTQNQKGLTDYYANAAGGGLRFETAKFHGFQFAVSGFYTFNIGSSDLGKPDTTTGQSNRYEIALFDVEDPYNKKDIDRLEEFYLKYNYKKSSVIFGRQLINTPFINLQDGRMRPTGVEGIWFEMNEIKKTKIEGGWLYAISPRGTTKWYGIGESIGIYPSGVNVEGGKSEYLSNLNSKAVLMLGAHADLGKKVKLHGWDVWVDNIFNTAMVQADLQLPIRQNEQVFAAVQGIRQDAINDGGNADPAKTYFEKGQKSYAFGFKAGWKNRRWETSVNYNRITSDSRYLMPREWGREPFFTFLPRERNEGFGNADAIMGRLNYSFPKTEIKASLALGYYQLPDVKDTRLNKYGMPSYTQFNADFRYPFKGIMKGLEAQLLVVGKLNKGETYNNKKYEFNKVDMMQYNLVLNFHF
ncbi:OprD family outer membrane porin [Flavihumibacter fluvii]|uniref:OprD family outer membrane porin n=1 Tax=Flavihumibacter fluvii TaxID=2838157 RepID=UPI001BDF5825|nr:OprD family outer membrane porin [Flavihumibacter fluvii]ULQ53150.1 OprD family outer membrane porin [Flavihumibacter fluvii]